MAVFAWRDVTDGNETEMLVQQTFGQRVWRTGASYSWESHCPYLKISIRFCEILILLHRSRMHFAETAL